MNSKTKVGLKREIGVWGLAANTVNRTIGAGIFVLPALVADILGSASILAYLICGLLMMTIMLCFSEIGSQITTTGGAYAYIDAAFGSYAGFLANSMFWFVGILADAAVANAMLDMLVIQFQFLSNPIYRSIFFFLIFGGFALINIFGVKYGDNVVKINTFIKLLPLFILIVAGFIGSSFQNLEWDSFPTVEKLGEASLLLFFAFAGGEASLNVSGEVKNPKRAVPIGILSGMGAVVLIYVLIQTVSQGVLGSDLIIEKQAPLAAVANKVLGSFGSKLIIGGAVFSMFAALSGSILSYPRVIYAGAVKGWLPPFMSKIHPKFSTPYFAIIVYAFFDFVFSVSGGFKQLAIIASASLLSVYFGVVLATIKLRFNNNHNTSDTFKLPFGITIPIFAAFSILWFLSHLSKNEFIALGLFLVILTFIYFLIKYFSNKNYQEIAD